MNNLKNYTRPLNNPIIQRCNNPRKLQRPVNNPNEIILKVGLCVQGEGHSPYSSHFWRLVLRVSYVCLNIFYCLINVHLDWKQVIST